MCLVSVIIPVYNTGNYLNRCVESIRNQTIHDIEIILVDDESPDDAPILCDEYAKIDRRIRVIHKKNGGLGLARNSGIKIAIGKYITFIDSDDYLDLDALEKLYDMAISRNLDICYGSFCYDKADGTKLKKLEVKEKTFFYGRQEVDQFLLDMVGPIPSFPREVKYSVSVCKAIYKLEVFKNHNLLFGNEKKIASEDFLFHLNLLSKVDRIGLLPICYYHYCENEDSITHTYSDAKFQRIVLSMIEVKRLLADVFPVNKYMIHFQRCLFLSLRGALFHDFERDDLTLIEKLSVFKTRCSNDAYSDLFSDYPFWKLGKLKMILYLSMKYKLSIPLYIILLGVKMLKK